MSHALARSQPIGSACWVDTPDRTSSSSSKVVQGIWDIEREDLAVVPPDLVVKLRAAYGDGSFDDFWDAWSKAALFGLFQAFWGGRPSGAPCAAPPLVTPEFKEFF